MARGCLVVGAILLILPLLVVGTVGVKTWIPLRQATRSLDSLEARLGPQASYTPRPSGGIPADRMDLFLSLRAILVTACDSYGTVQEGFEAVASLDSTEARVEKIAGTAGSLGSAALAITPFLARFFELRNDALLAAAMGLEEYAYIYAVAYHEQLLWERTRAEIFSDGEALSPEASAMLRICLERQLEAMSPVLAGDSDRIAVQAELQKLETDPTRLLWQDRLPATIIAGLTPYRSRLDRLFCGATAGLEMEQDARRALRLALE